MQNAITENLNIGKTVFKGLTQECPQTFFRNPLKTGGCVMKVNLKFKINFVETPVKN